MLVLGEIGLNLGPLLASAGIAGLAIGFGAQNLVKDFIAGLFMLLEDQYGVGDVVDIGETDRHRRGGRPAHHHHPRRPRRRSGTSATARSSGSATRARAGPSSSSTCRSGSSRSTRPPRCCARRPRRVAEDPDFVDDFIDPPKVLGVEQLTAEGAVAAHDGEDRRPRRSGGSAASCAGG